MSESERFTVKWSVDPGVVDLVVVYADEVHLLEQDRVLYGNAFLKPDSDGVHVRINPMTVGHDAVPGPVRRSLWGI